MAAFLILTSKSLEHGCVYDSDDKVFGSDEWLFRILLLLFVCLFCFVFVFVFPIGPGKIFETWRCCLLRPPKSSELGCCDCDRQSLLILTIKVTGTWLCFGPRSGILGAWLLSQRPPKSSEHGCVCDCDRQGLNTERGRVADCDRPWQNDAHVAWPHRYSNAINRVWG